MRTPTREEMETRLLANRSIEDRGYKTPCWIWTKGCNVHGYGIAYFKPTVPYGVRVHRVAAVLWLGFDLWSELHVLHHCDIPGCFNPRHLFIGTPLDNARDSIAKGRNSPPPVMRGELNSQHVLTEQQVRDVRARVDAIGIRYGTWAAVAREFGVTPQLIQQIYRRKIWKHV